MKVLMDYIFHSGYNNKIGSFDENKRDQNKILKNKEQNRFLVVFQYRSRNNPNLSKVGIL